MSLEIGSVLSDRYRIDGLLGEGGMGAVYRAFDLRLNLTVAVKESLEDPTGRLHRSTDPQARVQIEKSRERFKQEAEVLSRLKHPGLPAVRDHFIIQGEGQFLVMELVEGQDLQVLLKQAGRLSEERVIEIGLQMCDVLKYLHSQIPPVVHRDIKPSNLRVMPDGQIVLVDFGICKVGLDQLTRTAARAVSEGYSPPEMYSQLGKTDYRSDIYSLGATLLALVSGESPPSPSDRTLGYPLQLRNESVTLRVTALMNVIHRAMELKPEHRYQSATDLKSGLLKGAQSEISNNEGLPLAPSTGPINTWTSRHSGAETKLVDPLSLQADEKVVPNTGLYMPYIICLEKRAAFLLIYTSAFLAAGLISAILFYRSPSLWFDHVTGVARPMLWYCTMLTIALVLALAQWLVLRTVRAASPLWLFSFVPLMMGRYFYDPRLALGAAISLIIQMIVLQRKASNAWLWLLATSIGFPVFAFVWAIVFQFEERNLGFNACLFTSVGALQAASLMAMRRKISRS